LSFPCGFVVRRRVDYRLSGIKKPCSNFPEIGAISIGKVRTGEEG
jgi:hypothetical protein